MKRLFDSIHTWLKANVPHERKGFRPGATEDAIRVAEKEMGVTLPGDVRAAYRIHDGCDEDFLYGERWNSLREVVRDWHLLKGLLDEGTFTRYKGTPIGPLRAAWYHRAWIPISDNGGGSRYCVDLAPRARGHVGQVIRWCHDDARRYLRAKSFHEWVERFTQQLEAGMWRYVEEPGYWTEGT